MKAGSSANSPVKRQARSPLCPASYNQAKERKSNDKNKRDSQEEYHAHRACGNHAAVPGTDFRSRQRLAVCARQRHQPHPPEQLCRDSRGWYAALHPDRRQHRPVGRLGGRAGRRDCGRHDRQPQDERLSHNHHLPAHGHPDRRVAGILDCLCADPGVYRHPRGHDALARACADRPRRPDHLPIPG